MKKFACSKPKSWLEAYLPLVLWAALIFFFSSQQSLPTVDSTTGNFFFKKFSHIFVYAVLYFLSVRVSFFHFDKNHTKYWYVPILFCLFYALTDELHQLFTPYRTPNLGDIGFDMIGVSVVFLKQYRYI